MTTGEQPARVIYVARDASPWSYDASLVRVSFRTIVILRYIFHAYKNGLEGLEDCNIKDTHIPYRRGAKHTWEWKLLATLLKLLPSKGGRPHASDWTIQGVQPAGHVQGRPPPC